MGEHGLLLPFVGIGAAALAAAWLATKTRIPYPVFLVLLGLVLALVPSMPDVRLQPNIVFYGLLPPLLYSAAFLSSPQELRRQWVSVGALASVVVVATVAGVAAVAATAVPGVSWRSAVIIGAVVAPTDPVAATAVAAELHVPQRVIAILEGEGLVNDGVALVIFSLALDAVGHPVTVGDVVVRFVEVAAGGIALGLALGFVAAQIRRRLHDAPLEAGIALLTAYGGYVAAEAVGVSGVLAVVTAGFYLGRSSQALFVPTTRLQSYAFWEIATFLLNAIVFALLGLEFGDVTRSLGASWLHLVATALVVAAAVITIRLAAEALGSLVERGRARVRGSGEVMSLRERVVIAWSGMRGAISLAAALSIPAAVAGRAVPARSTLIFVTYVVILVTLVGQGATLPFVIGRLGVRPGRSYADQEAEARQRLAEAALERLGELEAVDGVPDALVAPLRSLYEERLTALGREEEPPAGGRYRDVRREVIDAQRGALAELVDSVDEPVLRRLTRELDLQQSALR